MQRDRSWARAFRAVRCGGFAVRLPLEKKFLPKIFLAVNMAVCVTRAYQFSNRGVVWVLGSSLKRTTHDVPIGGLGNEAPVHSALHG